MSFQNDMYAQPKSVLRDFEKEIENLLYSSGIFFRLFSRIKAQNSIDLKYTEKCKEKGNAYKMQDYIGFRIILYFKDDINIVENIFLKCYNKIDKSVNKQDENNFSPVKLNYVFSLPDRYKYLISSAPADKVDKTFEIQIRTIFSEGWHEVEHDFRYKCKSDWNNYKEYSRILNGILATLENCDWAIIELFEDLSYQNYKNKEWDKMLKNKFRLRFNESPLKEEIINLFNTDNRIAKQVFKSNRSGLIENFSSTKKPFTLDNIVYYIFLYENIESRLEIPDLVKELYAKTKIL